MGIYCVIAFKKISSSQLLISPPNSILENTINKSPYYPGKPRFSSTLDATRYFKAQTLTMLLNRYIHTPNPEHVSTLNPGTICINPRLFIRSSNLAKLYTQNTDKENNESIFFEKADIENDYMDVSLICPTYDYDLWDEIRIDPKFLSQAP